MVARGIGIRRFRIVAVAVVALGQGACMGDEHNIGVSTATVVYGHMGRGQEKSDTGHEVQDTHST
jgi:hypothetical protein